MFKPSKKEQVFFDLFSKGMKETCRAAELLEDIFSHIDETGSDGINAKIDEMGTIEHSCDKNVHDLLEVLNRSFITPIDREDIFILAKEMDNIVDYIDSTSHRIILFHITRVRPELHKMTELIVRSTKELALVVDELPKLKTSKTIHEKIIEVNRLENQGDVVYRNIIKDMFEMESNAIEVIKWKEIYEYAEKVLDACETVANIIEGIVTKNA